MGNNILTNIQGAWDVAKPFQVEDAEFAAQSQSLVLGHKTGLGKTFIAQLAWSKWNGANKGLIVGTLSSMAVWYRLLQRWGGVTPTFMQGGGDPNWPKAVRASSGVWMCTYATLRTLCRKSKGKVSFDVLINDELHRAMRSRNTQIYDAMQMIEFDHYLGLSATWASRGPQDLWPVLHLVNRPIFPSYWRFVETWCHVEDGQFGKEVYGVRNAENLRKLLQTKYYRRRTWPEVGYQFREQAGDPVIRRPEIIPMSKAQVRMHEELEVDLMTTHEAQTLITPNELGALTRQLQIAISPRIIFEDAEFGGPIDWLVDRVAEEPHTVIFCPFKKGLDVTKEALIKDKYDANKIFILKGGTKPHEINTLVDQWKAVKGVMLCTIDFAQSFDLDTTDTAYMLGFNWDPNDNYQAEGRLRRLDSILQSPCLVRYIIPQGSAYHLVRDVVNGKLANTSQFLTSKRAGKLPREGMSQVNPLDI